MVGINGHNVGINEDFPRGSSSSPPTKGLPIGLVFTARTGLIAVWIGPDGLLAIRGSATAGATEMPLRTCGFRRIRGRRDLHGAAVGEDRQVAEDHLFRAVDRRPGIVAAGAAGGLAARLVTSIHSPSLTPVWISVRTAWPFSYLQQKVLSPLWVRAASGSARTPGRSMITLA